MKKFSVNLLAESIFSGGQIATIVILSVLLAGLIGLCVYIGVMLHKSGEHKLQTKRLQSQRDALLQKLADMRAGTHVMTEAEKKAAASVVNVFHPSAVAIPVDDEDEEEEDTAEAEALEDFDEDANVEDVEIVEQSGAVVRYNRSFTARITQADNDLKGRYSELKNHILAFNGIRARMSWKKETFTLGRKSIASFVVRGKTLCLCLAVDPKLFKDTKYKVDDLTARIKKTQLPCMYRITSDRKMGYAKELVDILMAGFNVILSDKYEVKDYTLPYKSTEVLVKRRLIKVVGNVVPEFEKERTLAAQKGISYNRSFEARIIQSDGALKACYSKLKNHILAYKNVTEVDSWKRETFRLGRNVAAAFIIRGKTLCLCLADDPKKYDGTKYKVEDLSLRSKNTNTPTLYRVKARRRLAYAVQLVDKFFAERGVEKIERDNVNYAVPYVATETLVRRGLIKVTKLQSAEAAATEDAAEKKPTRKPPVRKKKQAATETKAAEQAQAEKTEASDVSNDGESATAGTPEQKPPTE